MAVLPLVVYAVFDFYKSKSPHKILKTFIFVGIVCSTAYLLKDFYLNYLIQAENYVKGNMICFGLNYAQYFELKYLWFYFVRYFAFLAVPLCMLAFAYNLKRKNMELALLFLFAFLYPLFAIGYVLGRTGVDAPRMSVISVPYFYLLIPYLLSKKVDKEILNKISACLLCILLVMTTFNKSFKKWGHLQINRVKNTETILLNVGEIRLREEHKQGLEKVKKFLDDNNCQNYLNLTNQGMHYLYFDKKIPILFVSYYNAISTAQSNDSLMRIKSDLPDVIMINSSVRHIGKEFEGASLALRMNSLYRYLFLSNQYSVKEAEGNIYLVKTNNFKKYSQKDLELLDDALSNEDLEYIPQVWGNSLKTLPLTPVDVKYTAKLTKDGLEINFDQKVQGKDIGLVLLETEVPEFKNQAVEFTVKNSNSLSVLKFKTKNGRVLFPFDNHPSWLLHDVKKLTISTSKNLSEIPKIEFYKRSNNLE